MMLLHVSPFVETIETKRRAFALDTRAVVVTSSARRAAVRPGCSDGRPLGNLRVMPDAMQLPGC